MLHERSACNAACIARSVSGSSLERHGRAALLVNQLAALLVSQGRSSMSPTRALDEAQAGRYRGSIHFPA